MSKYQNERAYLRGVCRAAACPGHEEFRWSGAVTVGTAQRMHERGEDVPVSGDAGLCWLRAES